MLELYHNNMSVCAQKVRLVTHEKKLTLTEHHMMLRDGDVHRPEYLKLNPKGVVPTLVDQGKVIIESTIICEYLNDAYPESPLLPEDPYGCSQVRQWTLLPDTGLHEACGALSVTVAWREQIMESGGAQLSNRPDYGGGNTRFQEMIRDGLDYKGLPGALQIYDATIAKMASSLAGGKPWLCGDAYTLADISMLPYVCRLEDLAMSWFWDDERAVVGEWLKRAKLRPNFSGIADYTNPQYVELCTRKGREANPRIKALLGRNVK